MVDVLKKLKSPRVDTHDNSRNNVVKEGKKIWELSNEGSVMKRKRIRQR